MFKFLLLLVALLINSLGFCTIEDGKNIVYTLPRPGISSREDCYLDIYREDLIRDIEIIKNLGATTVMTWNGWDYDSAHKVFLQQIVKHNLTLAVTFKPDLNGNMRRNLEKLNVILSTQNVSLEFVYLDFPLDFDNAEDFFQWILQVKAWMEQQNFTASILINFFPKVNDEKTIKNLAEKWDSGGFDAWVVEAYSVEEMQKWIVERFNGVRKKPFFLYGADSWIMSNSSVDEETQSKQLEVLIPFALDKYLDNYSEVKDELELEDEEVAGFYGSALMSFSDNLYLAESPNYYLGSINDVCPDTNPYIKTSCGGFDSHIAYGDDFYSVEYMGLFSPYETIYYLRCISPKAAAKTVAQAWDSKYTKSSCFTDDTCILSLTFPYMWSHFVWAFGCSIAISVLLLSCCKSCCRSCQKRLKSSKMQKLQKVLVE